MLAVEHGVHTVTELYDRLKPLGLRLSKSQLERYCSGQPKRLTMEVLDVFCEAFNVEPGELLVRVTRERAKAQKPKSSEGGASPPEGSAKNDLTGPPTPTVPKSKWHG